MQDKKVVFMGTPQFSVPVLEKLIEYTNVIAVSYPAWQRSWQKKGFD